MSNYLKIIFINILFSVLISFLAVAQNSSFSISGTINETGSSEPVSFSYIHLEELNRTAVSNIDGEFELENIPTGTYTLTTHRIGYRTQSRKVELIDSDLKLIIYLNASILSSEAIEVVGDSDELSGSGLEHASKKVFGSELRRNLGSTLSETLTNLPGFDQRSNGAAPGRPVIRGLGGERVMILQDGINSGDVSSQSSDHAVTIDPVSASEIEVARGPAALAYGSNAIGGVINVVKNQVRTTLPSQPTGTFSLNAQTVNTGISSALNVSFPVLNFAVQADLNGRYALDTQTPLGKIQNSFFETTNDALGISWIQPWGYAGLSSSIYFSNYGIPPDPNGHENGVDIELRKYQYDARSEILVNGEFIKVLEMDASYKTYNHKEIEGSTASGRQVIGTEFNLNTSNFDTRAQHNTLGFINSGTFGVSAEFEDYDVVGAGTPPSSSLKIGAYAIEESDFGALHLEGGLRFDIVSNSTSANDLFYSIGARNGAIDSTYYKNRDFTALSGSASAIYDLGNGFSLGTTILRSFRAPSLEELYSEGPHLASYSFEIGNPDLAPERAWAKELFFGYQSTKVNTSAAVFHNGFDNYIYAKNTGRANVQRFDLQDYQFVGTKAELYGFELSAEFQLTQQLVVDASTSFTLGRQDTVGINGNTGTQALPQVPPFKITGSIKYVNNDFEVGSRIRSASKQDRTGEFETETDGYSLVDLFSQYRFNTGKLLHTISLNLNNLLDETYFNHLSRIKDLRPEPGRNISLLYRVYF